MGESRRYLNIGEYKKSIRSGEEAFKLVDELLKASGNKDLEIHLVPYYYQLGNTIGAYVEDKTDVMGNLEDIGLESDDDDEEFGEGEEGEEVEEEGEPVIREEEPSRNDKEEEKIDTVTAAGQEGEEKAAPSKKQEWLDISVENLSTAKQILEDYCKVADSDQEKKDREYKNMNFIIKIYDRLGALYFFNEEYEAALQCFTFVIMYNKDLNSKGNKTHNRLAVFAHF